MSVTKVNIDQLSDAIMEGLKEYASLATDDLKDAVREAGKTVKKEIRTNAPKKTEKYSKSWTVKTTKETSNSLELTVHSPKRYPLAHLLEYGHAKRGGGRTRAFPHIEKAETTAEKQLEDKIQKALGG